ncbi:hypothetical protein FCULG_00009725 [Fusarium culmorum]|uniref:Uncharacterized protein n=1 Tax=Fusarium culmorum TaxID=5516 RepID=A0A2T4GI46_FUSCU|nr:hypothetical protein FCULG_00009725 [Fusarium culmorum]
MALPRKAAGVRPNINLNLLDPGRASTFSDQSQVRKSGTRPAWLLTKSEDPGSVTEPLSHIPTSFLLGPANEHSSAATDSISWQDAPALVVEPPDGGCEMAHESWTLAELVIELELTNHGISGLMIDTTTREKRFQGPAGLILSTPWSVLNPSL